MKKGFLSICTISLLLFSACNSNKQPNFIIIEADDAGYADFGFMGSKEIKTPNLDALAEEGVVFTDAHVSGSVCSPSRAGMLTGRFQHRFGHEQNLGSEAGLHPDETTLADILLANGYRTALVGKWHLGAEEPYHPNTRGYEYFFGMLHGHHSYFPKDKSHIEENGNPVTFDYYLTDVFGDKAVEKIEEYKGQPFYMHLSFNAVHTPLHATDKDLERFANIEDATRRKVAAMTWAMDRAIGTVIEKLKEEKLYNNTMIFFLSDNGGVYNIGNNYPLKAAKGTEFDGGHRVPFIMKYGNKTKAGLKFDGLTSALDIFPTIMHAAGIEETTGKPLDGVELLPYASGENSDNPHEKLFWRSFPWAAARVGDYKLVRASTIDTVLYNIANDIGEKTNLKELEPETYQTMLKELENWESEMQNEAWNGNKSWREVKYYFYYDVINNTEPRFTHPGALNKWKKNNPSEVPDWRIEYVPQEK